MKDPFAFYVTDRRLAASSAAVPREEVAVRILRERFFVPDDNDGAWLIYEQSTGHGLGVVMGSFTPHPDVDSLLAQYRVEIGFGAIPFSLAPILAEFGPSALRWNGKAVVASGQ